MLPVFLPSGFKLLLRHLELLQSDDRLMTVLHKELPHLPVVDDPPGKEIPLVGLLEYGVFAVLFVLKYPHDTFGAPSRI